MKVAIGCDPNAVELKETIKKQLKELGHDWEDYGSEDPVYANVAIRVAEAVAAGKHDRGILLCGTGIGMCIAANKVLGVRAAPCFDCITAEISRRHNDANILCLSADLLGEELIDRMVHIWLETEFEGGRHARRVEKITRYEENHKPCSDDSDSPAI